MIALQKRLIDTARELFYEVGYGGFTLEELARRMSCSKRTIYTRYPDKEAVFRAVIQDQIGSWETGANYIPLGQRETLEETLQLYGDVFLRAGLSPNFVNMTRLMFAESTRFPELAQSSLASRERGIAAVTKVVQDFAQKEGIPCRDPRAVAELFQLSLTGWSYSQILTNAPLDPLIGRSYIESLVKSLIARRADW